MGKFIIEILNGVLDTVYPPVCLVCGADIGTGALCDACRGRFRHISAPYCDRCGEPVSTGRVVCRRCEGGNFPAYDWSQAPYQYDGPMLHAIQRFKYDRKRALAKPLGDLLAESLQETTPLFDPARDPRKAPFDLIIPVPLHPSRLKSRGFNQAELLGNVVASALGWTMNSQIVRRVRRTPTQTAMTHDQRAENIRNAFEVVKVSDVVNKHILIVDDVLTSTSTAREISRVLMNAGAIRVCVLAVARSV